ncbi:ras association domain-containing protein 5 [Centropristis striata]|uniref:ras association domain-containing protein 5 n=1 Tax=Centropristis striata TaxID=184440 RepID=UPI0027E0DD10|nr:ras association domain-containing protein 5 [Centropristis striata]
MATVSVVGQHPGPHRLDSEPLLFRLPGSRKKITLPRKSSWEKMMFRRSSGSGGDCGSVPAEGESGSHSLAPGAAGEAAVRGGVMPGDGCGAPAAPAAPRSPDRDRQEGSTDCDRLVAAGSQGSQTGHINSDCNSNINCDSNRNTGGRRGASLKRSGINVMPSGAVTNGHKGAHRHRDAPHGRRDNRSGDGGHQSISPSDSGSLPLERLTQGRTGVVRLARTEPARREAWSIFPRGVDPRMKTERGEGHRFESKPCTRDWCDACSRQITAQALKCQNCSYTCHLECESQVRLDCNKKDREHDETSSPRRRSSSATPQVKQKETKEEEERRTKDLSEEEVRTRIEEYNAQVSENGMNLASDGSYTGFIKVHLRLSRPVTVPAVEAAGSEGASRQTTGGTQTLSECQEGTDCGQSEKRTSFYLPCDCVKQIHISSLTTTSEVIQGLLKKFMVLDNPRKFALYRQTHRDGQDLFQKLPLCERPLLLRLIAGPDPEQLSFVLKENETGEVEWHAFSVPELQNFLVILEKEESERVRAVEQKYSVYRQKLQQALQQHDP